MYATDSTENNLNTIITLIRIKRGSNEAHSILTMVRSIRTMLLVPWRKKKKCNRKLKKDRYSLRTST